MINLRCLKPSRGEKPPLLGYNYMDSITDRLWDKIGRFPHHGLCIILSSLKTKNNSGIGEYLDLLELIPFCKEIGFDTIQLLPLNDTGPDNTPYSAISSCALNPIYLSLSALPYLTPPLQSKLNDFAKYRDLPRVPYEALYRLKEEFLNEYFISAYSHFLADPHFLSFVESTPWLKPYALFKILKQRFSWKSWNEWDPELASPSKPTLQRLYKELEAPINTHILIQYLCHLQMKEVKNQATASHILLQGDIPILINPESVDVWLYRENFNLNYTAGAPPDMYSEEGQNWGFPIFQWSAVNNNKFSWWKERLITAAEYYDIFRIDHILGLYRIWAIEKGQKAIKGSYIPSEKSMATRQGEMILKNLLSFTSMLPIGEDLGIGIAEIRTSLQKLCIPGLKIPRWERLYLEDLSFIPYNLYTPYSVTSLSTHDSETLEEWWKNHQEDAETFSTFSNLPFEREFTRETRFQILKQAHQTPSFFHINLLGEYLALFPELVHPNPHDERINVPGTISPNNWSYRLRPSLEELNSHAELKKIMKLLIANPVIATS